MHAKGGSDGLTAPKTDMPTSQVQGDKTAILDSNHATTSAAGNAADTIAAPSSAGTPPPAGVGADRTIISRPGGSGEEAATPASNQRRKLVGWLVSYSLDPLGIDFKLFEGRNTVGRTAEHAIKLIQDPKVSSHHATILFRNGAYYVKDEMASNPSLINEVEIDPGQTVQVQDGDILTFGDHRFLLKSSIG